MAGDIVRTVAANPTLNSIAVLAGIVLIRTFLSWTLEVEIDGRWPWQKVAPPRPGLTRVGAEALWVPRPDPRDGGREGTIGG